MVDRMDVSDKTAISMPMRNLLSILAATAIGVYAFFGIQERLNTLETRVTLSESDLTKNTEFRIRWPRGELGSLPADAQQDLLLEFMASQVESMQADMESMMSNTVNIKRSQQDIERFCFTISLSFWFIFFMSLFNCATSAIRFSKSIFILTWFSIRVYDGRYGVDDEQFRQYKEGAARYRTIA